MKVMLTIREDSFNPKFLTPDFLVIPESYRPRLSHCDHPNRQLQNNMRFDIGLVHVPEDIYGKESQFKTSKPICLPGSKFFFDR